MQYHGNLVVKEGLMHFVYHNGSEMRSLYVVKSAETSFRDLHYPRTTTFVARVEEEPLTKMPIMQVIPSEYLFVISWPSMGDKGRWRMGKAILNKEYAEVRVEEKACVQG
jgi:hypothetical protein